MAPLLAADSDAPTQNLVVDVSAPVAVDTAYSYRVPAHLNLAPGDFVAMPLGTRMATGVVWATRSGGGDNLKSVANKRDWAPLKAPLRDFIDWVARWTLAPRGAVLRMAVRAPEATEAPAPKFGLRRTGKAPERLTPARSRVLAALDAASPLAKSALAAAAGCSAGVIDGLVDDGALEAVELAPEPVAPIPNPDFLLRPLEPDQAAVAGALIAAVEKRAFIPSCSRASLGRARPRFISRRSRRR